MRMKTITKKGFEAWLMAKPPKTKVAAQNYSCSSCPLARYINDTQIIPEGFSLEVGRHEISLYPDNLLDSPKAFAAHLWMDRFIEDLDTWSGLYQNGATGPDAKGVSAQRALRILRGED